MIMSSGHTGAGFVFGGLVGDAMNRADTANTAREIATNLKNANNELKRKIDDLQRATSNMFGAQMRLKADYEGMRQLIRELLAAIKDHDRESALLLAKNRDSIAGEASRLADDKHVKSMFSPQLSRRAGMMAVIEACTEELAKLSPKHKLISGDERFAIYWVAFQEEFDTRVAHIDSITEWAQKKSNTDKGLLLDNTEYIDQISDALEKQEQDGAKNGMKLGQ
jgi:hypothetical protein